jgi:hypothetical protein
VHAKDIELRYATGAESTMHSIVQRPALSASPSTSLPKRYTHRGHRSADAIKRKLAQAQTHAERQSRERTLSQSADASVAAAIDAAAAGAAAAGNVPATSVAATGGVATAGAAAAAAAANASNPTRISSALSGENTTPAPTSQVHGRDSSLPCYCTLFGVGARTASKVDTSAVLMPITPGTNT